ncbi:hypothetical protein WMF01_12245 [Sorangium sp. So ce1667]
MRDFDTTGNDPRQTKFLLTGDHRRRLEYIRRTLGERSAAHAVRAWIEAESNRLGYQVNADVGAQS